jgi:hypothetical protein
MKLHELTSLIRSKNAGPFSLTFDIMFSDVRTYEHVKASGALSPAALARLLHCSPNQIQFFICDNALAFKATIPRRSPPVIRPMPIFMAASSSRRSWRSRSPTCRRNRRDRSLSARPRDVRKSRTHRGEGS